MPHPIREEPHAAHPHVYPTHPGGRHPPPPPRLDRLARPGGATPRPTADLRAPAVVGKIVRFAAAFARSVAAACAAVPAAPSGQAVWDSLDAALPTRRRTLEHRLLPALHAPLGKRRAARVASDDHRVAYFGEPNRDTTRAKSAAGTHTSHTSATACVVGGPGRYTLGRTAVGEGEPYTAVLARLLDPVAGAGVTAWVVRPDQAFFSIAVMRLLRSRNLPFVIPAVIRGRKPRVGAKAVGRRAVRRRGAGRYAYTHEDRGASVRVTVVVAHKSYCHRKTGHRHARTLLYATWRVGGAPVSVRDRYRTRFGVESRDRPLAPVRPRTSATSGVVRLPWVAVGLIRRNAGVRLGAGSGSRWTRAAACLVLLAEALVAGPDERPTAAPTHRHASPPT